MANKALTSRMRIKYRIRKKVIGTAQRPRLSVFRSNKDIYCQLIDDRTGHTLAAADSRGLTGSNTEKSTQVGKAIGEKAKGLGLDAVVFDRSGYRYHGRVKALADGAREAGLNF